MSIALKRGYIRTHFLFNMVLNQTSQKNECCHPVVLNGNPLETNHTKAEPPSGAKLLFKMKLLSAAALNDCGIQYHASSYFRLEFPQTNVYQDKYEIYVLRHQSPLCFATLLWSNQGAFFRF